MSDELTGELLEELLRIEEAIQGTENCGTVMCDDRQEPLIRALISRGFVTGRLGARLDVGGIFNRVSITPRGRKRLPL